METLHTKDNRSRNGLQQTDSPTAYYKPTQKQQYYKGEHVARELGLRFRVGPPHSHQSNGAMERLHRTLFDQLRAVRLQRALTSLGSTTRETTATSTTMVATT